MKYLFKTTLLLVLLSPLSLVAQTSSGYGTLKDYVNIAKQDQIRIQNSAYFVNQLRAQIENHCKDKNESSCRVETELIGIYNGVSSIGFIKDELRYIMNGDIYYDSFIQTPCVDGGSKIGDKFTMPSGVFTYEELNNSNQFDYKIVIDNYKMTDNCYEGMEIPLERGNQYTVFQWDKNATIKSIFTGDSEYSEKYIMKANVLISKIKFTMGDGTKCTVSATVKQYDETNNGVELKLLWKADDGSYVENIFAKADDNGGYMERSYSVAEGLKEYKETFDANGNLTGQEAKTPFDNLWHEVIPFEDDYVEYQDVNESTFQSKNITINIDNPQYSSKAQMYVIVKKDDNPSNYEFVGFGDFYDANDNSSIEKNELYFDYFGLDNLLGNSIDIDNDVLDVYLVNMSNNSESYTKVDGIWFSK